MTYTTQVVQGYKIEVSSNREHVAITTPSGGLIDCLRRGTHQPLAALPKRVKTEISKMTGWVIT